MGQDIHMVLEKRIAEHAIHMDLWVGLHSFISAKTVKTSADGRTFIGSGESWQAVARNYSLFNELRIIGGSPRGVPGDASQLTRMLVRKDGGDGHSHTHMTLTEAWPLFIAHHAGTLLLVEGRKEMAADFFGVYRFQYDDEDDEVDFDSYRLVIWFDN